ncbi:MAG TPA: PucR family transcriptional regulator ligand-binding domain-containing protein [Limnochordales bacterium]
MRLTVADILKLDIMRQAQLVAGHRGQDRPVRWVHTWPEVLSWFHGGELLLTTGYSWPDDPQDQRRIVRELHMSNIAALLFQTGRYFPNVPPAVLEAADELHLPVLRVPAEVSFVELTETINREIIRRQYMVIVRSEEIHRTLTASALDAADVEGIGRCLASLLEKPVVVTDADLRPLAIVPWGSGGDGGDGAGPAANGRARLGALTEILSRDQALLRRQLQVLREPQPLSAVDGLGTLAAELAADPIVAPVRTSGELLGFLWIVQEPGVVEELDVRAAEHGAIVAGLHLLRQRALADAELRLRNSFVEALLRGEFGSLAGMRERAHLLRFDTAATYQVGLLGMVRGPDHGSASEAAPSGPAADGPVPPRPGGDWRPGGSGFAVQDRLVRSLRQALSEVGLEPFLSPLLDGIAFLVPVAAATPRAKLDRLWRRLRLLEPGFPLALAVGRPAATLDEIPRSLDEAQRTLELVREPGLYWYEDRLLTRILASVQDQQALADLWETTLGRLDGVRGGTALRETVAALMAAGFNRRGAARALNIHWNTLSQRIRRLEQLLNGSLDDPDLRLRLMLAMELERHGFVSEKTGLTGAGKRSG